MTTERDSIIGAGANREMFDRIARRYDLLNRLLSLTLDRSWRKAAVKQLGPVAEGAYLDIGTGTADVGLTILKAVPGALVTGIDPSLEMLDRGRRKLTPAGAERNLRFVAGDALALPFLSASFDGVISAFCIRNVTDHRRYMAEMHRVLRPGGRGVILELTTPRNRILRSLHRLYNRIWVPSLGALLSRGAAYRYLIESIRVFPDPAITVQRLTAAGFAQARAIPCHGGIVTIFVGTGTKGGTGKTPREP